MIMDCSEAEEDAEEDNDDDGLWVILGIQMPVLRRFWEIRSSTGSG